MSWVGLVLFPSVASRLGSQSASPAVIQAKQPDPFNHCGAEVTGFQALLSCVPARENTNTGKIRSPNSPENKATTPSLNNVRAIAKGTSYGTGNADKFRNNNRRGIWGFLTDQPGTNSPGWESQVFAWSSNSLERQPRLTQGQCCNTDRDRKTGNARQALHATRIDVNIYEAWNDFIAAEMDDIVHHISYY